MKTGIISEASDTVEAIAFNILLVKAPFFKFWPLSMIAKFVIDKISQPVFNEGQRFENFRRDRADAAQQGSEAAEATTELQETQDAGGTLEDPKVREQYEKWKQEQADVIRFGGPADRNRRP